MKIKLTPNETVAVEAVIMQLYDLALATATTSGKDGILSATDIVSRLVVMQLRALMIKGRCDNGGLKFNASTGLALLAAWYATDIADVSMTPLAHALMSDLIDKLGKAYAGPIIAQH